MDTLTCKNCHRDSSVTSYAQVIRCHFCSTIISVGNNNQESAPSCGSSRCLDFFSKPSRNQSLTSIKILEPPAKGKRALLCGVSYKGQKHKLKGSTQDVLNMQNLLFKKQFSADTILILAEEDQFHHPTKENILYGFDWLTKNLQAGDSLVFYYSGHGLRTLDVKEEEIDGFDESICPVDFATAGLILDNKINEKLVQSLKQGVTLHAIIDACHSGTVLDLPHVYNLSMGDWDPPHYHCGGTGGGKAICFSACEDYQLASDTTMFTTDNSVVGAMTHTFIQAINQKEGPLSYLDILKHMNNSIIEANKSLTRGIRRYFYRQMMQVLKNPFEILVFSHFEALKFLICRILFYLLLRSLMLSQSSNSSSRRIMKMQLKGWQLSKCLSLPTLYQWCTIMKNSFHMKRCNHELAKFSIFKITFE